MELQELIARGRFILGGAPRRLHIFSVVNGINTGKDIARKIRTSPNSVANDLKKLFDTGLIQPKYKDGEQVKKEGSVVYEKVPLARQVPLSYFTGLTKKKSMVSTKAKQRQWRGRSGGGRLRVPSETEILEICKKGEDSGYEFKAAGVEGRKLTKEVAGFAHGENGGIILYGVDDDGAVVGTDLSRAKLDHSVQNSIRNTVKPALHVDIKSVKVLKTEIIVVLIPPWNRRDVYYYEGRVYLRKGANIFEASPEEIKQLHSGKVIG